MKVTYLNEKPEPRNPIILAIIPDSETVYDQKVLVMIYGEAIDMMNKICSNTIATSGRNMSKDGEPS